LENKKSGGDIVKRHVSRFVFRIGIFMLVGFLSARVVCAQETESNESGQPLSTPAQDPKEREGASDFQKMLLEELARELSNPVSYMDSLTNEFQYRKYDGDLPGAADQESWTYLFQPKLTSQRSNGYNLIFRPAIPVILDQPAFTAATSGFETNSGLGDISFDLVYGRTEKSGFLWSVGLFGVLPTATDDALGQDQWQVGPDIVLGLMRKWGVFAALCNHVWDVAGNDEVKTSLTSVQVFYYFSLGGGWEIGAAPVITYDWEAGKDNRLTLPVGLGIGKTTKIGKLPLKMALEVDYSLVRPDSFGEKWQVLFSITPVITRLL